MNLYYNPVRGFVETRVSFAALDAVMTTLQEGLRTVRQVTRTYVDASSGAVAVNLPNGNQIRDMDFMFVKTDASVNGVTINPFPGQGILGATSALLPNQGSSATLAWDPASQSWWTIA